MQNQTRNLVIVALIAALVAVTCWNQSTGQIVLPGKPAVARWEYKTVPAPTEGEVILADKNWEVCAACSHGQINGGTGTLSGRVVLKRPKAEK